MGSWGRSAGARAALQRSRARESSECRRASDVLDHPHRFNGAELVRARSDSVNPLLIGSQPCFNGAELVRARSGGVGGVVTDRQSSFNGAELVRARSGRLTEDCDVGSLQLQRSRARESSEWPMAPRSFAIGGFSLQRSRARESSECSRGRGAGLSSWSFNGAELVRARSAQQLRALRLRAARFNGAELVRARSEEIHPHSHFIENASTEPSS